ncbi:MAG: hypothetical protein J2P55_01320 [Rhizobiales bacterium]|nr:hypothetical protein [Hyphomicrobiales bacterium]
MQVTVTISHKKHEFPAGTTAGDWRVIAIRADKPDEVAAEFTGPDPRAAFDLPDGDYHFRAQRLDAEGHAIGPIAATEQITVSADRVSISAPVAVDAKVG